MEAQKDTHRLQAVLPKSLVTRARIVAAYKGVMLSEVVRVALLEHVERMEGERQANA